MKLEISTASIGHLQRRLQRWHRISFDLITNYTRFYFVIHYDRGIEENMSHDRRAFKEKREREDRKSVRLKG